MRNKRPFNVPTTDACAELFSVRAMSIRISPTILSAMVNPIEHGILFMFCFFYTAWILYFYKLQVLFLCYCWYFWWVSWGLQMGNSWWLKSGAMHLHIWKYIASGPYQVFWSQSRIPEKLKQTFLILWIMAEHQTKVFIDISVAFLWPTVMNFCLMRFVCLWTLALCLVHSIKISTSTLGPP